MAVVIKEQRNWESYGLCLLRDVDVSHFLEAPMLLNMGKNNEEALKIISKIFGVSEFNPMILFQIFGQINLIISFDKLKHIVEKRQNGRERFALFAQATLLNPYEVWMTAYDDGGFRYVYIGLFKDSKYHISVVINITPDGNMLWNYMNGELRSIQKNRIGQLLFSKK